MPIMSPNAQHHRRMACAALASLIPAALHDPTTIEEVVDHLILAACEEMAYEPDDDRETPGDGDARYYRTPGEGGPG